MVNISHGIDLILEYPSLWSRIYIIITKNIHYLLWNRGLWRSLNNTYPIFLTLCIRCTNHLGDSYDLIDVNPHFILSLLRMIQMLTHCDVIDTRAGRQQLRRHNDGLFPRGCYGHVLSSIWCWGQWFSEFVRHVCAKFINGHSANNGLDCGAATRQHLCLSYFSFYFVTPVFQHGASLVTVNGEQVHIVNEIQFGIFSLVNMDDISIKSSWWKPMTFLVKHVYFILL